MSFGDILKHIDPELFKSFLFERYKEDGKLRPATVYTPPADPIMKSRKPIVRESLSEKFPFMTPLADLPKNHIAWKYILSRRIPEKHHRLFHYLEKSRFLNAVDDRYTDKFKTEEPRICLPYYNREGKIVGITARALEATANKHKYIIVRLDESETLIFGIDRLDPSKPFFVVEGPIDSLFLNNAIAASTFDLTRVGNLVELDHATFIFDNQPRNKDVCRVMEGAINKGYTVFVWPDSIGQKDINDLVVTENMTTEDVEEIIDLNSFVGLEAKNEFTQWRKC